MPFPPSDATKYKSKNQPHFEEEAQRFPVKSGLLIFSFPTPKLILAKSGKKEGNVVTISEPANHFALVKNFVPNFGLFFSLNACCFLTPPMRGSISSLKSE